MSEDEIRKLKQKKNFLIKILKRNKNKEINESKPQDPSAEGGEEQDEDIFH